MNTSVENDFLNEAPDQIETQAEGTALGQLGQAIRRSTILFIVAIIALIISYIIIINRENVLQDISTQVSASNQLTTDALEIREAEKDFRLTLSAKDLTIASERYDDAIIQIESLLDSSNTTSSEIETIEITQTNLTEYNDLITQAFDLFRQRGIDGTSGINKQLREQGIALTKEIKNTDSIYISSAAETVRSKMKDFVIFERADLTQPVKQAINNFRSIVSSDSDLSTSTQKNLLNLIKAYDESSQEYFELSLAANDLFDQAAVAFDKTLEPLPQLAEQFKQREQSAFRQVLIMLIITALVLAAIFALIILQLRNAQTGANKTLKETLEAQQEAVAENERLNDSVINILQAVSSLSDRDLTARAPVTEDVIGTVSDSINLLADETSTVLKGVTNIAGQVSEVSNTVKSQAEQVTETAEEERKSVQSMIETLFDATQTMNQVAALAEQSNESATQATEVTENALETVNQTVGGMESIRETISETEKRIKRLGERSQEISGIVNLINTISERTHVLALNASMQAAVAGEAGRGFAVVAEEVQQLAESSRNATEQIATLVNNIQIETNETINTVNRTIGQVVEGSEQAQQAGEQMRKTQEITAELVGRVQNIARASEQQKNMSAQLLEAVQAIGDSTEKTAAQIDAQNASTEELQQAAKQLVDSVNVFKLPA